MRRWSLVLSLLLASPTIAHAQYGVNISWDDCGLFGQEMKASLCNANTGSQSLVVSFRTPDTVGQLVGLEASFDMQFDAPAYSPWWDFRPTVGCRAGRMSVLADLSSASTTCPGTLPPSVVSLLNEQVGSMNPNRARFTVVAAVPQADAVALNGTDEYSAFRLVIHNSKTTGVDACGGCATPACIVMNRLVLYQPAGVGDLTLVNWIDRAAAFWQCPGALYTEGLGCGWYCPTGNRKSTWGSVKGVYR